MSIVEVRDLTVRAGAKVLVSNVSLDVEVGTWCTIVGPNGAGKTSLVETIAGLRRIARGSVNIDGRSLATMNERQRARIVSLVPQHPEAPAGMPVKEYIALGRTPYHGLIRAPSAKDRAVVDEVIERLALGEFAERDLITLSGGERQRTVLARSLAQSTAVIVLDEPITGLDLRHQMTLLELLKAQAHQHGLTIVATMHDLTLAGQFADRLVLLDRGEVVLDGVAGDVVRSPELAQCYGMQLRVVDVDGADVVVPVRS
jgi:iron complex transport system ATP-binding protein